MWDTFQAFAKLERHWVWPIILNIKTVTVDTIHVEQRNLSVISKTCHCICCNTDRPARMTYMLKYNENYKNVSFLSCHLNFKSKTTILSYAVIHFVHHHTNSMRHHLTFLSETWRRVIKDSVYVVLKITSCFLTLEETYSGGLKPSCAFVGKVYFFARNFSPVAR